ncbi:MAG: hypothetical protein IT175_00890 [Acidobacteria bacterium]|nr:hypothetical protein [Acidobacteriota bacterium]
MGTPRPLDHVHDVRRRYPHAFDQMRDFRAAKGRGLPDWPDWCWVPMAGAYAVVSGGGSSRVSAGSAPDIALVSAVSTWRRTQGIYVLDSDILEELWHTPVAGDLPTDVLERLPEWCVYVETPGREIGGIPIAGFYAHLEWDTNDGRSELRLLIDLESGDLVAVPLHLGGDLRQAIDRMIAEGDRQMRLAGTLRGILDVVGRRDEIMSVSPLVSVVLYLCSEAAEIATRKDPKREPAGFRDSVRTPNSPTIWETAVRLGNALRTARTAAAASRDGSHASPRPHIRRAHWHHFWTGPKDGDRKLVLRWMHPVLVAGDDIVPVVRTVD